MPWQVQVVVTMELPKPRALPLQMAEWLEAARSASEAVVYVSSLGRKASASNIGNTPIDGPAGSHMVRKVLQVHLFPALAWFFLGDSGGIFLTLTEKLCTLW